VHTAYHRACVPLLFGMAPVEEMPGREANAAAAPWKAREIGATNLSRMWYSGVR